MYSRAELLKKYNESNIFNSTPVQPAKPVPQPRVNANHSTLENTKNDLFHLGDSKVQNSSLKENQRKEVLRKQYASDIFNQNKSGTRNQGVRRTKNNTFNSSCFDSMKDNKEYSNDLKKYSSTHRASKVEYNPDKYLNNETPAERIYNQLYDNHENYVFPEDDKKSKTIENSKRKSEFTTRKKNNNLIEKLREIENSNLYKPKKDSIKYGKKGTTWSESNSCGVGYIESNENPKNASTINKQLNLQSNIFGSKDTPSSEQYAKQIKEIIKEKNIKKQNEMKENEEKRPSIKPEEKAKNVDKNVWGVYHTKWESSNLDWKNPGTELMFSKTYTGGDFPNQSKTQKTAFQKKLYQLADSANTDTINETEKARLDEINKEDRLMVEQSNLDKISEALNDIPDSACQESKKRKALMNSTTFSFNEEDDFKEGFKTFNSFYKRPNKKMIRANTFKITSTDEERKADLNKSVSYQNEYDDNEHKFVLSYGISNSNFDKYNENDIKKMFGKKGIHIYAINKNLINKNKYNTITFKVRGKEGEDKNELKQKLQLVQKDLAKDNHKILINEAEVKDNKKTMRHLIPKDEKKVKYTKGIKKTSAFTKQYNLFNPNYKKNDK